MNFSVCVRTKYVYTYQTANSIYIYVLYGIWKIWKRAECIATLLWCGNYWLYTKIQIISRIELYVRMQTWIKKNNEFLYRYANSTLYNLYWLARINEVNAVLLSGIIIECNCDKRIKIYMRRFNEITIAIRNKLVAFLFVEIDL